MRPGWGVRHPALTEILRSARPAAVAETAWLDGALPLRIAAYTSIADVPADLVLSVRCIVRVDDDVVVCWDRDGGVHPWPGGRRKDAETFVETACREVLEETGWHLDPNSLCAVGWLHLEHISSQPPDHPWPHPDFLQLVYVGRAGRCEVETDGEWTDTEGYVLRSQRMSLTSAMSAVRHDPVALAFLDLLAP